MVALGVGLRGAPVDQVVGLDAGDDRDPGRVLEERCIRLIRLNNKSIPCADSGTDLGGGKLSTDDVAGISPGLLQHNGSHGRGGGLTVGSRDRDPLLAQHEGRQRC